jgi:hypothetical protein
MVNLYSEFLEAEKRIAKILRLKSVTFKNTKYETPKVGVAYICEAVAKNIRFIFYLKTETNKADYTKWTALSLHLYFYNDYDVCQFDRHREFKHLEKVEISQWACEAAKEYKTKKDRNALDILFGDRDIRVRGIAGVTNATLIEFIINLRGYLDWGADRLLVYRFHHGTGMSEGFSYAFLIESRYLIYDYSFWCVFPAFVGMSGGTGYGGYKQVESLLEKTKKEIKVKILDIHVPEEEFLEFLRENNVNFMRLEDKSKILMKQLEEPISSGPSRIRKYSLSKIPGEYGRRIFIGGNYDNITVLREIQKIVSDLGYQPILALEFDVPTERVHDVDLLLLRNCKYSVFEITMPNGHLMELERAKDYGVRTLMVFQARDEKRKPPPSISSMVLSLDLPIYGYLNFEDLKKRILEFLAYEE